MAAERRRTAYCTYVAILGSLERHSLYFECFFTELGAQVERQIYIRVMTLTTDSRRCDLQRLLESSHEIWNLCRDVFGRRSVPCLGNSATIHDIILNHTGTRCMKHLDCEVRDETNDFDFVRPPRGLNFVIHSLLRSSLL